MDFGTVMSLIIAFAIARVVIGVALVVGFFLLLSLLFGLAALAALIRERKFFG